MTALTHIRTISNSSAAKSGRRLTLGSLVIIALLTGAISGLVYIQAGQTQVSDLRNGAGNQVGAIEASRKVRCIMPPAWRKDCGE